jgi:hypothetical protein
MTGEEVISRADTSESAATPQAVLQHLAVSIYVTDRLIRSESLGQKQLVQIKTWAFAEIADPSMFGPGRMYEETAC